jgi:hypothetical protein
MSQQNYKKSKETFGGVSPQMKAVSTAWQKANKEKAQASVKKSELKYPNKKRYNVYKNSAKARDIPFLLTFEDFETFAGKVCFWCGDSFDKIRLDRVDSSLGYTLGNVVPCCWPCNDDKSNRTVTEWLARLKKIVERHC